jgi:hypothetical protein
MSETHNPQWIPAFAEDYQEVIDTEAEFGFTYNLHPNEPRSREVASSLYASPIPNLVPVEGNKLAAERGERFIHYEIGSSMLPPEDLIQPFTYEQARAQWLWSVYRSLRGVIDCHNNKNLQSTFGSIGDNADPITLHMAGLLGIQDIVIMGQEHWSWYKYFELNKNLLLVEGNEQNRQYSVDWWRAGLAKVMAGMAIGSMSKTNFRFFNRLPDIKMSEAKKAGIVDFEWEPNLETPLPEHVAASLGHTDGTQLYALAWPMGDRTSYAAAGVDYFGEIVAKMPVPPPQLRIADTSRN